MDSTTLRKIVKYAGYPLFFVAVFLLFLFWTFPLAHFKPALESQLTKLIDRPVRIEDISMSPTGNIVLSSVEIEVPQEEPTFADSDDEDDEDEDGEAGQAKPKKQQPAKLSYLVDEMVIDLGLFSLLFDELDIDIEMDLLGGEVSIRYDGPLPTGDEEVGRPATKRRPRPRTATPRRPGPAGLPAPDGVEPPNAEGEEEAPEEAEADQALSLVVEAEGLELRQIHDLRSKLPLPITGTLDLTIELSSSTGSFADADGSMTVGASSVVLGSADAQIDVGGMPMSVDPIAIAKIDCKVEVEGGTASFKAFETQSTDFDAEIRGDVTFSDPLSRSRLDLYLMFKFLDGYAAKSQKAGMLISSLDDFSRELKRAHRDDGFYGFRYRGVFGSARLSPSKNFREKRETAKKRTRKPRERGRKDRPRAGAAGLPSGPTGLDGARPSQRGELPVGDVRIDEPPRGLSGRLDRPTAAGVPPGAGPAGGPGMGPNDRGGGAEEEVEEEAEEEAPEEEVEEEAPEGEGAEDGAEDGAEENGEEEAAGDEGE